LIVFQPEFNPRLFVTGHFEIKKDDGSTWGGPVWTGKIDSNIVEVLIEPDCLAILNDPAP